MLIGKSSSVPNLGQWLVAIVFRPFLTVGRTQKLCAARLISFGRRFSKAAKVCFQNRTAECELSQLAAAAIATGAFFMKFRVEAGDALRIGTIRAPVAV